jgi:hypothetical protein
MSLYPAIIRPAVSAETIGKVTRMFTGNIHDVIAELFQNARRAGSSRIDVSIDESRSPAWAFIRDDGQGIASPEIFVTLGQSGWDTPVRETEDPAGMGVFSLAGKRVTVTSRAEGMAAAWTATIPPEAWLGEMDVELGLAEHAVGTTIAFELTDAWQDSLESAVARHARYLPIPVDFQQQACARQDFLEDAFYSSSWNGCTIGVIEKLRFFRPTINFHGLTLEANLASVHEVRGRSFAAIVDMGPSNDIQLVLPARKEVVQNAAWASLQQAAERVIYQAIATLPEHHLAFAQWQRASALGVILPEAKRELQRWCPRHARGNDDYPWGYEPLEAEVAVLTPALDPVTAHPFQRAMGDHPLSKRLARRETAYVGYSWYDALPVIDDIVFFVSCEGGAFSIVDGVAEPTLEGHVLAETITLAFMLRYDGCAIPHQLSADVALIGGWDTSSALDDAIIVWRQCEELAPRHVVELLERAYFCAGEDPDDDSVETQEENFVSEAFDRVTELMCGAEEALCDQFRRALHNLTYIVPEGSRSRRPSRAMGPWFA